VRTEKEVKEKLKDLQRTRKKASPGSAEAKRQLGREVTYKEIAEFAGINQTIMRWVASFATTAIEGNEISIRMMDLWENDREQFVREVIEHWDV